ncbi:hypothetical protein ACFX12_021203 [Malus domestica]
MPILAVHTRFSLVKGERIIRFVLTAWLRDFNDQLEKHYVTLYVAKRRYDICGKSEDCLVLQDKELLERFIDREELMDRGPPDL